MAKAGHKIKSQRIVAKHSGARSRAKAVPGQFKPVGTLLTDSELRFVDEYLVDSNATRATIAAGFPAGTAKQYGYQLLRRREIATEIRRRQKLLANRLEVTSEKIIGELATLGFANIKDFFRIDEKGDPHVDLSMVTRQKMACIQSIQVEEFMDGAGDEARPVRKTKITLYDKRMALVDLGKHLGLFDADPDRGVERVVKFTLNIGDGGPSTRDATIRLHETVALSEAESRDIRATGFDGTARPVLPDRSLDKDG